MVVSQGALAHDSQGSPLTSDATVGTVGHFVPLVTWRDHWDKRDTFLSASDSQHSHSMTCRLRVGSGALQKPLSDSPLGYISGIEKEVTLKSSEGLAPIKTQFSSVTQLCPTLCDPMHCSTLGFPVRHQLLELTQIHVH